LIPEIGEVFEVDLGEQPSTEALGELVGVIGSNKVLQENLPRVQSVLDTNGEALDIAANWVERSGVQKALDRSLWLPFETPQVNAIIATGAVANWQDR